MATLSVVLATFNEERNISKCLDSVKDFASEIIIVDGTSHDKTVDIAKEYDAKVIITENHPNFHINKQKAIDHATKDWILQMDADELVSPELAEEIKKTISDQGQKYDGFWIPRKNWFLGRFLMKGGQYPDYTLRVYRRGKGRLPQKDVHEQAIVEGEVGYLKNALLHYPYENFSGYLSKWKRYVHFEGMQLRKKSSRYNAMTLWKEVFLLPVYWFLLSYIRHKGFMDLWPGFVFSFFSALRFPASYFVAFFLK